jgi:hypothetical protein
VAAVSKSVTELLVAWQKREIPRDVYEATRFVPFPHPAAPKLVEKFPAGMDDVRFEALGKRCLVFEGHRRRSTARASLFAEPPASWKSSVATLHRPRPTDTLRKRIAERYVAAYQQVG